jgi:excisionase family DNA binding protein
MSDSNTTAGQSIDATRVAAALAAFLDLPRVMRDLETTLRTLRSVVSGADARREDRLADGERGLWDAMQVARFLRVSRSWVYQRAESGLLPCRHVGGLLRFEADVIREYARTGKTPDVVTERRDRPVRDADQIPRSTPKARPDVEPSPVPQAKHEEPVVAASAPPSPPPMSAYDHVESLRAAQERLLGVRQVAERLRVSTATVYKLCDKGELPHTRVVNAIRVAPEALEAFIVRQRSPKRRGEKKRPT